MFKSNESSKAKAISPIPFFIHCIIGILICFFLAFLSSILINFEKLSPEYISYISPVAVFIGAGVSGFLSPRKYGKGLVTGLLQGLLFFIILFLSGAVLFTRIVPQALSPTIPICCFSGALAGAIISSFFKRH